MDMYRETEKLENAEAALKLLWSAAEKVSCLGLNNALCAGITEQAEAVERYCFEQRGQMADFLREQGELESVMALPGIPGCQARYVYGGDHYLIHVDKHDRVVYLCNKSQQVRREQAGLTGDE